MMLATVRTARQKTTHRAAFTLLEVLVVCAILVILAGVASISIFRYMDDARISRAKADMQAIEKACKTYYSQNEQWPDPNNLQQTIGPLLEGQAALIDPWNNQYTIEIGAVQQPDGSSIERVLVHSNGPTSKSQPLTYPEIDKGH